MKNKILTLIFVLAAISAMSTSVLADERLIIADFDSEGISEITWRAGDAVEEIITVPDPERGSARRNILAVYTAKTDSSVIRTVSADFESVLDLSEYKNINASVYVDRITYSGNNSCFVRITVHSADGDSIESIVSLEAGLWQDISVDISSWNGRQNISSLEFGVIPDHVDAGIWDGGFTLDNIYAAGMVNTEMTDRYSFEKCTYEGGSLYFAKDNTYFEFVLDQSTDISYIEFDLGIPVASHENALRINIENRSNSNEFTAVFLRGDDHAPTHTVQTMSASTAADTYFINVKRPAEITGVRLEFPNDGGSVVIRSIGFTSIYNSAEYITYGNVSRCELSADRSSVSIAGELPREYVTEFEDKELLLYALELNENARDYDYESAEPIARHGMSTKFRFTVDIDKGSSSSKFQKYVVMISSTPMVFVDTPTYISESASVSAKSLSTATAIGLCTASVNKTVESGSGATILDVYLDELISVERSGYMYTADDGHYYFTKSYVDELDRKLGALKTAGVSVSLRMMTDSDKFKDIVYGDSSASNRSDNIQNDFGYSNIRAAVEFLAQRYVGSEQNGGVDSFIVGKAVNSGNLGDTSRGMSMTDFVNSYADLMRLVYLSAENTSRPVTVYASVGDIFEYEIPGGIDSRFDTGLFAEALGTYIADEGDFLWGICVESYTPIAHEKSSGTLLSASSAETFDELFDITAKLCGQSGRSLIPVLTADHIDYTAPSDSGVADFAVSRLMSAAKYGRFDRYMLVLESNSPYASEVTEAVKAFTGGTASGIFAVDAQSYEKLIENKSITTLQSTSAESSDTMPIIEVGRHTYFDFNSYDQLDSISLSYNSRYLKLVPMQTGSLALRAELEKSDTDEGESMGIGLTFPQHIDLEYTPVISFDIMFTGATTNAELLIRFRGDGAVCDVKAELAASTWQTVYAELGSAMELASEYNSVELLLYASELDTATLYVDNIIGYSGEYSDEKLTTLITSAQSSSAHSNSGVNTTVVTVFAIIITALISITAILILRSRRK